MAINNKFFRIFIRLLKWITYTSAVILVILFSLLAGAANPIINAYIDELNTAVSQGVGKSVTLSSVKLSAFPWLNFEVESATIEGLFEAKQVTISFNTWRALISLGSELEMDELTIEGIKVKLHRDASGLWNFESHQSDVAQDDQPENTASPADPEPNDVTFSPDPKEQDGSKNQLSLEELQEVLNSIRIGQMHIKDLSVTLHDELKMPSSPPVTLIAFDLTFPTLDLARELKVQIEGGMLNSRDNFSLSFEIGPYDHLFTQQSDPQLISGPLDFPVPFRLQLKGEEIDFSAISQLLQEVAPQIASLKTGGEITIEASPKEALRIHGDWRVEGIDLNGPQAGGLAKIHFAPSLDIKGEGERLQLDIDQTQISLNEMELAFRGGLTLIDELPTFRELGLQSKGISFERIFELMPALKGQLPPRSKISGPLQLSVLTSGQPGQQSIQLGIQLDQAQLIIPDQLHKTPADPLHLRVDAGITPTLATLKDSALQVGAARLLLTGESLINSEALGAKLKAVIEPTDLNSIARLVPSARTALGEQGVGGGQVSAELDLSVHGQQSDPSFEVTFKTSVKSGSLDTGELKIIGDGSIEAHVKGKGSEQLDAQLNSNLKQLTLQFGEAFNKPKGTPFDASVIVQRSGLQLTIPTLELNVANLTLVGEGKQSEEGFELSATLPKRPLEPLLSLFGASKRLGPDLLKGKLGFSLNIQANHSGSPSMSFKLKDLTFNAPQSDLSAEMTFSKTQNTSLQFNLNSNRLDLDALFPPQNTETSPASSPSGAASSDPAASEQESGLDGLLLNGNITVKKGVARGLVFEDLNFKVAVRDQQVMIDECKLDTLGGKARLSPMKVTLSGGDQQPWDAHLELESIQIEKASEVFTGEASALEGRLSGGFDLTGRGLTWSVISQSVNGSGRLALQRGILRSLSLKNGIFGSLDEQALRAIPSGQRSRLTRGKTEPLKIKTLSGAVEIKNGALHTQQPLKAETPQGPIESEGSLGLDGSLKLKNTLQLNPQQLSQWIGRRVSNSQSIPVSFNLGGTLTDPKMESVAAVALVAGIAAAYGLSMVDQTKVKEAVDQAKKKAQEAADQLKKRGEQAAREAADQAKQKADEARAKARAEAEKREAELRAKRKAAEDQAKRKAEEAKRKAEETKRKAEEEARRKAKQGKSKLKGLIP